MLIKDINNNNYFRDCQLENTLGSLILQLHFQKEGPGSASPELSRIKLSTPTLSLNSKGDLVTCPCAFRCRRLAENLPRESGLSSVGGLLPLNCWIALKWQLRDFFPFRNNVSHQTCTQSSRPFAPKFPDATALVTYPYSFPQWTLTQTMHLALVLQQHFSGKFPHRIVFVTCPCVFRLRKF